MNIEHISVSRYQVFQTCEEKYRLQYHEKIPTGPEEYHFTYGKMVHKIAEEYVRRADTNEFQNCVKEVLTGKIEIEPGKVAPPIRKDYVSKFEEHMKSLRNFINTIGLKRKGEIEYRFHYDLSPPNKYHVTGFIDRLIVVGDTYSVIDYKTTKKGFWRKNETTILHDLQLRTYAKVIQRDFGVEAKNIQCCLFYLDGGNLVGARFSQKDLDEAEEELRKAYIRIHNLHPDDVIGNVGDHCSRCPFRKDCRFWKLT